MTIDPEDGSTEAGIAQCQNDPVSCDLVNKATEFAIKITQDCKNDPLNCGLKDKEGNLLVSYSVYSSFSADGKKFGILYIPEVQLKEYQEASTSETSVKWVETGKMKDIYMSLIQGGDAFRFEYFEEKASETPEEKAAAATTKETAAPSVDATTSGKTSTPIIPTDG